MPTICVMADPDLKIKSDRGVVPNLENPISMTDNL
jgi:hypothetical protein